VNQVARFIGRNRQRRSFAFRDIRVAAPVVEQGERVAGCFMGPDIAENRCQRQQLDIRMGYGIGNRHCVIDPGISVYDNFVLHGVFLAAVASPMARQERRHKKTGQQGKAGARLLVHFPQRPAAWQGFPAVA